MTPTISSEVATGRRMNGSEMLMDVAHASRLRRSSHASETLALLFLAARRPMNGSETLTVFPTWPFSDLAVSLAQAVLASTVAASLVRRVRRVATYTGHLRRLVRRVPALHPPMRDFLPFGRL